MDETKVDLAGCIVTVQVLNLIVNILEKHGSITVINAYRPTSGSGVLSLGMELEKALSVLKAARA